jgi:hypothetical protein
MGIFMGKLKNWKTTATGGLPALAVILQQISLLIDGDPSTSMSFSVVALAVGAFGHSLFAKDHDVK